MTIIEVFNLISSIASLILAIVAIWLSLYFYDKSKGTEKNVESNLREIKSQTQSLEKLSARLLDRFTRYSTSAKPADETYLLLLEYMKSIQVTTTIEKPSNENAEWANELVSAYIALHYYAGLTNVATQSYLPAQNELQDNDLIKGIIDNSNADFLKMDNIISNVREDLVTQNPLYNLYKYTIDNVKTAVKDSTTVYRYREGANL